MSGASPRWRPQPGPQTAFIRCRAAEAVYGGARGGGKTDAVLGDFAFHAERHGPAARGLLVRRARRALEPTIERAREIYRPQGAVWRLKRERFEWPSGALLYIRALRYDDDAGRFLGHDYTRVYVEELTQFASPAPLDRLKATLRSAAGVRCAFRATCNPGGAGHGWVKARYIDPTRGEATDGAAHGAPVFIPARLADNPALIAADPAYADRLREVGSANLVRAWLEGDWSAAAGAFFDGWSEKNVIAPFTPPEEWRRFRAFDWGYRSPFSVGWWCVVGDEAPPPGAPDLPRGALVRYREWYGADQAGLGLKLAPETVAAGILERERAAGETVSEGVADRSMFGQHAGPSIAERMAAAGVSFSRSSSRRTALIGPYNGWDHVRARIAGRDGAPMLYVFDTCRDFIRTVPTLRYDTARLEDLASRSEDHIADETRYACLWVGVGGEPPRRLR